MKHESMKADRNNPNHLEMSSPSTFVASRRVVSRQSFIFSYR